LFLPPIYAPDQHVNDLRFATSWDWEFQKIEVRLIHYCGLAGRVVTHGEPVVMAPKEPGVIVPPTLSLSTEQAQQLMDQLWRCGCRPTEAAGSAGSLAATQKHLEDMRTLVFRAHGIQLEERK
jgi:hypothetical protein